MSLQTAPNEMAAEEMHRWANDTLILAEAAAADYDDEGVLRIIGSLAVPSLSTPLKTILAETLAGSDAELVRLSLADLAVELAADGDSLSKYITDRLADDTDPSVRAETLFASHLRTHRE